MGFLGLYAGSPAVLVVEGLRKRYGRVLAVDGVSFSVGESSIVGLVGPNGAGKTTTIKSIVGLVRPDSGRILVDGVDVLRDPRGRAGLGYVPELPYAPPWMTPCELLERLGVLDGLGLGEARSRARSLLGEVGLAEKCGVPLGRLSKGEKKRVLIAQALLVDRKYYLLDEPLSGLDPEWVAATRSLIAGLRRRGAGVLVSSHMLRELEEIVDSVVIIAGGRVLFRGSLEELAARLGVQGYVVTIRTGSPGEVARVLEDSGLARDITFYGGGVRVVTDRPEEVVELVRSRGFDVRGYEVSSVSLEDAYLQLVAQARRRG